MWSNAVGVMAEGAEHVAESELAGMKTRMGQVLDSLNPKPYLRLKKMHEHRWGTLRLWPKWKSLKKIWGSEPKKPRTTLEEDLSEFEKALAGLNNRGPNGTQGTGVISAPECEECEECGGNAVVQEWQQVKWRPVVSYSRHHLRNMLALAGRWAIFLVETLQLGDYAGDPREVTESVHRFNARTRTDEEWSEQRNKENEMREKKRRWRRSEVRRWRELPGSRELKIRILDLANFFICVPRKEFTEEVLPALLKQVEEKFPDRPLF